MALRYEKYEEIGLRSLGIKPTSMCSLIIWNISKALENKSCLDLKHAIRSAHERLERDSRDDDGMTSQPPEQRYLTCALLAWQQLGHKDADSLYRFVEENRCMSIQNDSANSSYQGNIDFANKTCVLSPKSTIYNKKPCSKDIDTSSFDTISLMGPVVKLPVETRIVMRMENPCNHHSARKSPKMNIQNDISNKIDAACCKDSVCVQRLAELDTAVKELRNRAAKLARREAERVELLERAEAAWKDLELGYQRRLRLAEEKEDDLEKQIKKTIEERNSYKTACANLAETLKQRGEIAEKERSRLVDLEKEVCERACLRLQFCEESSQHEAALAEQLCRTSQLDRDLQNLCRNHMKKKNSIDILGDLIKIEEINNTVSLCTLRLFKEEQARRKVWLIENDVESARCLTHEAERTMRVELAALKDQIKQVSEQLMAEETDNQNIKLEIEELLQEKSNIIEDLDGCKVACDSRMQGRVDELNKKRDHLMELKEKVIECQCKLPIDISIEAKRTPSLAALCHCSPEDKVLDSCSCTSLRSQLLTNLLADLFGGLQSEINSSGSIMPCHLLKCLEEKHNWDRSSIVKTNLRNFFSKLLVGELDIAIATSIEKYHAKWVGKSCADQVRPECGEDEEGWQERAIERRAQKLASKFAEQLFKERADLLTKKAKDIVSKGPPPCQCKNQPAVFPCIVKAPTINNTKKFNEPAPTYLKRTIQDVTRLRLQIEDLKKESVKKEDLWQMEEKIAKIVQRASIPDNIPSITKGKFNNGRNISEQESFKKQNIMQKFNLNDSSRKSPNYKGKSSGKVFKRTEQSYAVNICLCGPQTNSKKVIKNYRQKDIKSWSSKTSRNIIRKITSAQHSQPIKVLCTQEYDESSPHKNSRNCPSKCVCLHKVPSNSSIDKLLETLIKWKGDLTMNSMGETNKINNNIRCSNSKFAIGGNNVIVTNCNQRISNMKAENGGYAKHIPKYSNTGTKTNHTVDSKSTDYFSLLPPTTDSIYIGQINLDKSNDDLCKCDINQYRKKINDEDGNNKLSDELFSCINTDICKCVNIPELNHEQNISHNGDVNRTVSQCFSVEFSKSQFENIKNSKKKLDLIGDTYVCDIVKQSEVLPRRNYQVNLLGVTLTNTNELNNKDIKENDVQLDFRHNTIPDYKQQTQCNTIDAKSKEFCESIMNNCCTQNSKTKEILEVVGEAESSCVCCDEKELSNDLEINAFNLIEEHLKGKLADIKRKCKSTCLQLQEETKLFSTILQRVKEVISDSTNPLICKYTEFDINDVSWSRAYGLLQEYIKIKIKRVQCDCLQCDMHENSVLPNILEKICNLIENDFQRLKDKCKCENKRNKESYDLKDLDKQISKTIQTSDILVEVYKIKNDNISEKHMEDSSLQISSHVPLETKSCAAMSNIFHGFNTTEKLISCELTNVYATDCKCRSKNGTRYGLNGEIVINPITISNGAVLKERDNSTIQINNDINEISNIASFTSLKEDAIKNISNDFIRTSITKYPYYGYTLNCSCDHSLGKCHCIKSMIQTNNDKIDFMWESLKYQKCPKIMSYIMSKVPAARNINSEPVSKTDNTDLYNNSIQSKHVLKYSNRATVTSTSEDFVLKVSQDKVYLNNTNSEYNISTYMDENEKQYSHMNKSNSSENKLNYFLSLQNGADYNKHLLYDSLYLPTDKFSKDIKHEKFISSDDNLKSDSAMCSCMMVPVCHVKMLVENIEKKLMEFKCTCDSLDSRLCPVHPRGEFNSN